MPNLHVGRLHAAADVQILKTVHDGASPGQSTVCRGLAQNFGCVCMAETDVRSSASHHSLSMHTCMHEYALLGSSQMLPGSELQPSAADTEVC